jgi:hypothetical protein
MTVVNVSRDPVPGWEKAQEDGEEDQWLRDHAGELSSDDDLAECVFATKSSAFASGYALSEPEESAKGRITRAATTRLYKRSKQNRRVLFLELMAWAINQAEVHGEDKAFFDALIANREKRWAHRPWPGAAESPTAFLDWVRRMAEPFAESSTDTGLRYPNRKKQPPLER